MPARLAQHLVSQGLLPAEKVEEAIRLRAVAGGTLDTVLLEQGLISEAGVLQSLADVSGYRLVNLADFEPNEEIASLIPPKIAERMGIVPLSVDDDSLHIACSYPVPLGELNEVGFLLGKRLELWIAVEVRIRDWISTIYKTPLAERYAKLMTQLEPQRAPAAVAAQPVPVAPGPSAPADAAAREMVERAARDVADEPIPLEVRKAPRAPGFGAPGSIHDRDETVSVDALGYAAFARESAKSQQQPARPSAAPQSGRIEAAVPGSSTPAVAAARTAQPAPPPSAPVSPSVRVVPLSPPSTGAAPSEGTAGRAAANTAPANASAPPAARAPGAPGVAAPLSPPGAAASALGSAAASSHAGASTGSAAGHGAVPSASAASPLSAQRGTPTGAQATTAPGSAAHGAASSITGAPRAAAQGPASTATGASASAPHGAASTSGSASLGAASSASGISAARGVTSSPPAAGAPQVAPLGVGPAPSTSRTGTPVPLGIAPVAATQRADSGPPAAPNGPAGLGSRLPHMARSATSPEFRVEAPPPPTEPRSSDDATANWSLVQARAALRTAAQDRDQIIDVALRFARRTFEYAAAFAVVRGAAVGWDARGAEGAAGRIQTVSIPLDTASVFRTVTITRGSYVGPVPPDSLSQHYLEQMGRSPRSVFLFPLEVKSRLVALLYADAGQGPISQRKLSDFLLFCQELPAAFQELLVQRKRRATSGGEGLLDGLSFANRAGLGATAGGLGWSPSATKSSGSLGRAASMPGLAFAEAERPPPDFAPLLRRLTGPDPAARSRAMAELARTPEPSSEVLAKAFPGPSAWSRTPVLELPEADELGPVPAALARLGRSGAKALAPLLDSPDSDTRYLALLTAGNLPFGELVDGVLRAIFDLEPDISSAARAAATALRRQPRFDNAMRGLRQELTASDPLRRSLAARALGVLHDRDAVDGLIGMTGSDDAMCAQAAAEALKEITRVNFGPQQRRWTEWWANNRDRRRVQWIVGALRSPELDTRSAAIEELAGALNDSLGYAADAPEAEREQAVRRWEQFVQETPRGRRLEL